MFEAKAGAEEDFVRAYGPDGDWAQLFRRSGGGAYLDSQLARDIEIARRFVTIDRWASRAAFTNRRAISDRKSTRLNSSHGYISYAVFCLKKKNKHRGTTSTL